MLFSSFLGIWTFLLEGVGTHRRFYKPCKIRRTNKTPKVWKNTDPYKTLQGTPPGYVDNDGWGKENGQLSFLISGQQSPGMMQCVVITQEAVGNLLRQLPLVCFCSCKECANQTSVSSHNEVTDSSSFCGIVYFVYHWCPIWNIHFFTHPKKSHRIQMASKQKLRESRINWRWVTWIVSEIGADPFEGAAHTGTIRIWVSFFV